MRLKAVAQQGPPGGPEGLGFRVRAGRLHTQKQTWSRTKQPSGTHYTDTEVGHVTRMWDTHFLIEGVGLDDEFASYRGNIPCRIEPLVAEREELFTVFAPNYENSHIYITSGGAQLGWDFGCGND